LNVQTHTGCDGGHSPTAKNEKKLPRKTTRIFSNKQALILAASIILVVSLISATLLLQTRPQSIGFSLKAGIIDQLGEELPNPSFVNNVTSILETHHFNVTYHNGTLDVAFFKNLAKYDYGIIILRTHAALRDDRSTVDLFTSEPYVSSAHRAEQDNGLLVEGVLNYSDVKSAYFALTPKFIESLDGNFPKSIVIAMGCNTVTPNLEQMAEAFHKKGAEVFIGWNGYVGNLHTDIETVKLLTDLLANNKTVGEAVDGVEWDMVYGSRMACYPQTSQALRISDLTSSITETSALSSQCWLNHRENGQSF
jgi:hypothetical protein